MAGTLNAQVRRVAQLESDTADRTRNPIDIPLIAARPGEGADEAIQRHVRTNGPLPVVDSSIVNAIVLMPVAPKGR